MTAFIKICGLRTPPDIAAAADAGATHAGFVFDTRSRRAVSPAEALVLKERATVSLARVAVVTDATDAQLDAIFAALQPDIWQLHGTETPERCAAVGRRFARPVMKAFGIQTEGDLAPLSLYSAAADFFLLDAKPPTVDATAPPGGHGRPFDWRLLAGWRAPRPWFLSGGLSPANVAAAVETARALAVDVSSGVESASGAKDPALIRAFCQTARRALQREALA
jgi:phosphoribosylanthranilate isomerase